MSEVIDFRFDSDLEAQEYFKRLKRAVQNNLVLQGMKKAGIIINKQAKQNFLATKKNKSKTGYKGINNLFKVQKVERLKKTYSQAIKIGIKRDNIYRNAWHYKFQQWGTEPREYTIVKRRLIRKNSVKTHRTGKVSGTNFFYGAVEAKKAEAMGNVNDSIIAAIKKHQNKNSA